MKNNLYVSQRQLIIQEGSNQRKKQKPKIQTKYQTLNKKTNKNHQISNALKILRSHIVTQNEQDSCNIENYNSWVSLFDLCIKKQKIQKAQASNKMKKNKAKQNYLEASFNNIKLKETFCSISKHPDKIKDKETICSIKQSKTLKKNRSKRFYTSFNQKSHEKRKRKTTFKQPESSNNTENMQTIDHKKQSFRYVQQTNSISYQHQNSIKIRSNITKSAFQNLYQMNSIQKVIKTSHKKKVPINRLLFKRKKQDDVRLIVKSFLSSGMTQQARSKQEQEEENCYLRTLTN